MVVPDLLRGVRVHENSRIYVEKKRRKASAHSSRVSARSKMRSVVKVAAIRATPFFPLDGTAIILPSPQVGHKAVLEGSVGAGEWFLVAYARSL